MYKYLLLAVMATGITARAAAQVKVPAAAKAAFEKAYPDVKQVKWEKEGDALEAGFMHQGKHMSVVYSQTGALQETEETIAVSALPAAVTNYVKEHYKGVRIAEAAKITKANGEVNYEAEVHKKDILFDAHGRLLKY
ncbi:PepSY-like domain-containing protein [Chitinophaga qingshengii]|uniref:PepSY-like domain-containing protein n=1 Tax=Chitinophaga qingshengii TaxID=1569794 RepID=A0ABR7TLX8_9BACT|nr:PepSY-like domain-containing protein [Chitinophaga qingshengii]MBC9930069.1 PepSY-like domain-containing protein [Chitinophaga qingshengii]